MYCSFEFNSYHPHKLNHCRWLVDALQILFTYLHNTHLLISAVQLLNDHNNTIYFNTKGCMGQRFCNAVVWIAELVRVKGSWKLIEISLTTLF